MREDGKRKRTPMGPFSFFLFQGAHWDPRDTRPICIFWRSILLGARYLSEQMRDDLWGESIYKMLSHLAHCARERGDEPTSTSCSGSFFDMSFSKHDLLL